MRLAFMTFLITALLGLAVPVKAHHSYAGTYDGNKPVTIHGTISKLTWSNPHAHFHVDVMNQKGETTTWDVETATTIALARGGINKGDFFGQEVVVTGFLARDGTPTMAATRFTLPGLKKEFGSGKLEP
jgi:hypothetical protein